MRPYARWRDNIFTKKESSCIISKCLPSLNKGVFGKPKNPLALSNLLPWLKRNSNVAWISQGSDLDSLMQRAVDISLAEVKEYFYIPCKTVEEIQFTEYKLFNHYGYHLDTSSEEEDFASKRLVSATIQLSDPADYWGGHLKIDLGSEIFKAPERQGTITIFPSGLKHKVTPVLKGTRYSLVLWIHF